MALTGIAAVLLFVAVYIWPTRYIYRRTNTDTLVRIHRFSERVDVLTDNGWIVLNPFTDLAQQMPQRRP
jgi:hypothetical protein